MTGTLVRLAAVLTIAACTAGCSTISGLIGDDTPDTTPAADANGFPPDTAPANADGSKPDLAAIPDKPTGTTSPDAQRATSDSLAADAARSRYSSDALRGGTEPAAAPPPPPSASPPAEAAPPAPQSAAPPPPTSASDNTAPAPSAPAQTASAEPPTAAPPAQTAPAPAQPAPEAPSVAPAAGTVAGAQPVAMSDAALGFKPSSAPPLDPSISQFVAPPIIARYQETAANAGVATGPIAPVNGSAPVTKRGKERSVGGSLTMSGAVVANLGVLSTPAPSVYTNAIGGAPQAVVLFPGDGTAITAAGRAQIRSVVAAFRQRGGAGYIKVVGHSSSRTANMPIEKHLMTIFAKSQARANSVAHEIIREGVPASHVLVEAVGDSQPVYYESMPQGEAGNRRAEIFLQG